jgi:hypothetical protein
MANPWMTSSATQAAARRGQQNGKGRVDWLDTSAVEICAFPGEFSTPLVEILQE